MGKRSLQATMKVQRVVTKLTTISTMSSTNPFSLSSLASILQGISKIPNLSLISQIQIYFKLNEQRIFKKCFTDWVQLTVAVLLGREGAALRRGARQLAPEGRRRVPLGRGRLAPRGRPGGRGAPPAVAAAVHVAVVVVGEAVNPVNLADDAVAVVIG